MNKMYGPNDFFQAITKLFWNRFNFDRLQWSGIINCVLGRWNILCMKCHSMYELLSTHTKQQTAFQKGPFLKCKQSFLSLFSYVTSWHVNFKQKKQISEREFKCFCMRKKTAIQPNCRMEWMTTKMLYEGKNDSPYIISCQHTHWMATGERVYMQILYRLLWKLYLCVSKMKLKIANAKRESASVGGGRGEELWNEEKPSSKK